MARLRKDFEERPRAISGTVRSNRDKRIRGYASQEHMGPVAQGYLIQEVPFSGARTAAHFTFGLGEVFDLMEAGRWDHAEALVALMLVSGEQSAMEDWRWANAWRLTHLPEVPMHSLLKVQGSTLSEPVSHLADNAWIAAAWAYSKETGVFKEASRKSVPTKAAASANHVTKKTSKGDKAARVQAGGGAEGDA